MSTASTMRRHGPGRCLAQHLRAAALLLGLAPALGAATGCRPQRGSTTPTSGGWQAKAQALQARVDKDPDDLDAWRDLAHVRWIHLGQAEQGATLLRANAEQRGDLASRLSLVMIADAHLDPAGVTTHGYALIEQAAAVGVDDPQRAFADAAAETVARRIAAAHGDQADDDTNFVAMFDPLRADIDAGRSHLSFAALQPLLSLRAAIARRHGEDYRQHYGRAGCVQQWAVGPLRGHLGALELPTVDVNQPLPADTKAELATLSCVVRVWNPTPAPGVRRMRSELDVKGDTLHLDIGAEFPSRFYLDGHLIHRTDVTEKFEADRVSLRVQTTPGRHVVDVVTAIPVERAWVMLRATDAKTQPIAVVAPPSLTPPSGGVPQVQRQVAPWSDAPTPLASPMYTPLRALLAIDDALAEGDSDRAELARPKLARAKNFAVGQRTLARFERADPSRGRTVSAARERKALERAVALDPALDSARLRMLRIDMDRGEDQRVADALAKLDDKRLRSLDGQMLRYQIYQRLGREYEAEQALSAAEKLNPDSCRARLARRAIARDRDDVRAEDGIVASLASCAGSLSIRAKLAERRGDISQAVAHWSELLARTPDDLSALESLARLSAVQGDHDGASGRLQRILSLNPYRVGSHIAMADLAASRRQPEAARSHLQRALSQIPHSNALRRAGETLGLVDELSQWRADGRAALAEYRASGITYEGVAEVLVLDRSVVRVYENGGQRQIVHIVAHLLNKEAFDRYGEINIPDGAQLLALHTIKPDGTLVEPEVIAGKDGLSLRHLEVGDVVEYEFVVEQGPSGPMPGYVDVSTFRFQSLDVPYHRSELQVIHPATLDVRSDRRNDPPEEIVERKDGVVSRLWRAREVPRRGVEPGHRPLLDELPNVHVYTEPVVDDYLGSLAVQVRESQRTNPALRRLAKRLTKGDGNDRQRLMSLWTWVVENVEDRGDLTVPATLSHAARGGNRLMLLRAMLHVVGIEAELWLARDSYGTQPLPGGHPMLGAYDTAMLAVPVADADQPLMVLTASKVMPPGYLPPGLRGTQAMRLALDDDDGRSGPVRVPTLAGVEDRRQWDLDIEVNADGAATVAGVIELTGMEAVFWRQALRDVDRDRIEEVFEQAELQWLRGATLSTLEIEGDKALNQPLRLKFSAEAPGLGIVQDGALVLRAAPMPMNPSARYAALPRRTTGLVVPYAPVQVATLRYHLADGSFTAVPEAEAVTSDFGRFERTVTAGGAGKPTLTVQIRSSLRTGVVEPQAYPELAEFARDVDTAEQAVLRAK